MSRLQQLLEGRIDQRQVKGFHRLHIGTSVRKAGIMLHPQKEIVQRNHRCGNAAALEFLRNLMGSGRLSRRGRTGKQHNPVGVLRFKDQVNRLFDLMVVTLLAFLDKERRMARKQIDLRDLDNRIFLSADKFHRTASPFPFVL